MTHLLDANACIDHLRKGDKSKVAQRMDGMPPGAVVLCSVVLAELLYGARGSSKPNESLRLVTLFSDPFDSLPFDDIAAEHYGVIRAELAARGTPIGPNDLMIAAIAKAHNITLVTHNTAEFSRVPGLNLEDWQ